MSPWLPQLLADQRVDLVAAQLTALAQRHGHPLDGVPVATHQSLRLPLDGSHHAAAAPRGCRAAEQRDEGAPPHGHPSSGLARTFTTPSRNNAAVHHSKSCALMSQMGYNPKSAFKAACPLLTCSSWSVCHYAKCTR